jgi:hypothetical protein
LLQRHGPLPLAEALVVGQWVLELHVSIPLERRIRDGWRKPVPLLGVRLSPLGLLLSASGSAAVSSQGWPKRAVPSDVRAMLGENSEAWRLRRRASLSTVAALIVEVCVTGGLRHRAPPSFELPPLRGVDDATAAWIAGCSRDDRLDPADALATLRSLVSEEALAEAECSLRARLAAFASPPGEDPPERLNERRAVLADRLEAEGMVDQALWLRLEDARVHATSPESHAIATELKRLAPRVTPAFLEEYAAPSLERCPLVVGSCPRRWDRLEVSSDPMVGHCPLCDCTVRRSLVDGVPHAVVEP